MPTFTYTLIPCDENEPFQEFTMSAPADLEENIGCLTKALNKHYTRVAPMVAGAGKQAAMDAMKEQLKKQQPSAAAPDDSILSALAQSQTVDIVQLIPATQQSNYMGVGMYVDDKGQSKQSPHNSRASAVCTACGVPTDILGDAFLARTWDDQEGFERQDFKITDLSSDAPWVKEAARLNANRQNPQAAQKQLYNMADMANAAPQKPKPPDQPLGKRLAAATVLKGIGTESFKKGEHEGAAAKYAEAIALLGSATGVVVDEDGASSSADGTLDGSATTLSEATTLLITCLVNVATCKLKLQRPYEVIEAADHAIALDEANGKAWFRRGEACIALEQYSAARKNLSRAAQLLPAAREVREAYNKATELAAQKKASAFDAAAAMDVS